MSLIVYDYTKNFFIFFMIIPVFLGWTFLLKFLKNDFFKNKYRREALCGIKNFSLHPQYEVSRV